MAKIASADEFEAVDQLVPKVTMEAPLHVSRSEDTGVNSATRLCRILEELKVSL